MWRTDRLVGQVLAAAGRDEDARTSIAAAADIVRAMLDQLDEAELARSFGSRPEVRSALGDAGADAGVRRS